MKVDRSLLLLILLLFFSGSFANAGPVGDFFRKVGQSISKPRQPEAEPQPQPQPQSRRPQPAKTSHADVSISPSTTLASKAT